MRHLIFALCCLAAATFTAPPAAATEGLTAAEINAPAMQAQLMNAASLIGAVGHCEVVLNHPNPDKVDETAYERLFSMLRPLAGDPDVADLARGANHVVNYAMRTGDLRAAEPDEGGGFRVTNQQVMTSGAVCQETVEKLKALLEPGALLSPGRNL